MNIIFQNCFDYSILPIRKNFKRIINFLKKNIKLIVPYGFISWHQQRKENKTDSLSIKHFEEEFYKKAALLQDGRFTCRWADRLPCLNDATPTTEYGSHYVYHIAWAAREVANLCPKEHYDISSSLYFISLLSAFVPVKFYDYRPALLSLSHLECGAADLMNLPFKDHSISSLSCMHVVEHIGLERYGEAFDPKGDVRAVCELSRVLTLGGSLLFVVPVSGQARIQYNAHRIYTFEQVMKMFPLFELVSFSLITDKGDFISYQNPIHLSLIINEVNKQQYGCGCFHFKKFLEG